MRTVIEHVSPSLGRVLLAGATVSCLLVTACSRVPSRAEVPGVYQATYPFGHETLVLRQDGSYSQEISIKRDGSTDDVYRARGAWRYSALDGCPREAFIDFDSSFLIVFDQWGEQASQPRTLRAGGISAYPVEKIGGRLRIVGASEKSYAVYQKKDAIETNLVVPAR